LHPRYRQTCRVCGSDKLKPVIDLGAQYLQGSFTKPGVLPPPLRKLPTELMRCDVTLNEHGCGLLQMHHSFPPEILYANYWYRSATNQTMRDHLGGIVKSAMSIIQTATPSVLDIGCNDGTLLDNWPQGSVRYGVDPSDIANEISDRVTVINTVFPSDRATAQLPEGGLDVVTSIAMFYDLEDPVGFARAISRLLNAEGVWIFEMSYLPLMLLQNSFDTICHEHLEYYSLAVLEDIARRADLRIFKAQINDINGGSIRCYAASASNTNYGTAEDRAFLHRLRIREFEMGLDTDTPYIEFQDRIDRLKTELNDLLFDIRAQGQRIHIYGASTKGNVLLQWYGINRITVDCAADRNPQKVGSKTLGTEIPIVSEETSRAARPDYYLVLPWHFRAEFLRRERDTIMAGTKMIFPLPQIEVVTAETFDAALVQAERAGDQLVHLLG
jgi:NDP-4-keto-2,6-dideoxyhexose 3-C-methyltransferase